MGGGNLRVICGPTAAGKSGIAMWLAREKNASIISADSRQIYRGFDIGTAKPTPDARAAVAHYGIDILEPDERYSASRWSEDAERWIAAATAKQSSFLVVGGTGLYVRALVSPFFDAPPLDAARRSAIETYFGRLSLDVLRHWCSVLDPAKSHLGRVQMIRAIGTALLAGVRLSALQKSRSRAGTWKPHYLLVDPGAMLKLRIEQRMDEMLARDWVGEVARLNTEVPDTAPAWNATGYRAVRQYVRGALDLSRARELSIFETRQYAKRQRTWFRHQLGAAPVTPLDPVSKDWTAVVERWWKESS